MHGIKRVVIPVDRSDASKVATEQGAYLARLLGVDVVIINVSDSHRFVASVAIEERLMRENEAALEEFRRIAEAVGVGVNVTTRLVVGVPADEIVKFVRDDDLIVMASHGKKGIDRFLLGSVSEEVLRRAPCSVMIIKPNVSGGVPLM
ncbi:MAG: hypothetical protein DRN08_04855 [Thermoplasmata archaeon]|nr:MAG: hypothetical protein DRN05_03350 [Thermoplasmata archaeon]RLF34183.1 MAG: hypothetical protein DRN08_04855 [Thermoplasmata archaeon]